MNEPVSTARNRRVPKIGIGFAFLRFFGIVLQAIGVLVSVTACVGFVIILARSAPAFASAVQYTDSPMAGFVTIIMLAWLLVPLVFAFLGVISIGLGYVLHKIATRPASAAEQ